MTRTCTSTTRSEFIRTRTRSGADSQPCASKTSFWPSAGTTDFAGKTHQLSTSLWNKGIGNALRLWDGWSHDWPYWEKMLHLYIGGHD